MNICRVLVWAVALVSCARAAETKPLRPTDVSFRNEVQRAFEKGNDFLQSAQNSNGWWSTPDHPSVAALAVSAMMNEPGARLKHSPGVRKGCAFILSCVKADGGIYVTNLANYNTSISMMALLAARDPKHNDVLRKARSFVAGMQADLNERGQMDSPWDGGIGYSHDAGRSDMNNTLTALEALYYSKHLIADKNIDGAKDLNWAAAIQFLQNCQNLPGANKQDWVSTDAKDRGGFVYDPGTSKAGAATNATGKVALRSYGSISYAGLLSYIYADVKPSDPRVQA
ncbi:MAG TPA: prenyltransferase/squalene oxidase repeat-containing protein, partial [Verrucomicrobiae bacterium]